MLSKEKFSKRNGFNEVAEVPITVRNDAPYNFRGVLVDLAYEFGFTPHTLRDLVCKQLRTRADLDNWSAYPNVNHEVRGLVDNCQWFKVYDILEEIASQIPQICYDRPSEEFQHEINEIFMAQGIGLKLVNGEVIYRGEEGLDELLILAVSTETKNGHKTAATELHEAIKDMSRRPEPSYGSYSACYHLT